ncbi:MAG: ribulose-phosphate 3-epimerase [Ruminococcaceae bacterium]|nr:ribulose-phosphate 3-epimerase [Oscillospiraceae bacterium]
MIKISPSILSCDFSKLGSDVEKAEKGGAEYLHIDVMDGLFVPNISLGSGIQKSIRNQSKMVFDTHLMIVDPIRYIDDFYNAGSDIITIHYESCENVEETLEKIHSLGIKAGLSIKPKTPISEIKHLEGKFDMLLIMSVEPGFGGQSFIPESLDKIKEARALFPTLDIEVDGGINESNINSVVKAGANILVAGSAVFGKEDVSLAIETLRKNAEA